MKFRCGGRNNEVPGAICSWCRVFDVSGHEFNGSGLSAVVVLHESGSSERNGSRHARLEVGAFERFLGSDV